MRSPRATNIVTIGFCLAATSLSGDILADEVEAKFSTCRSLEAGSEQVKQELKEQAIKRLAEHILFKVEVRDTVDHTGLVEDWVSDGREIYSTRFREYINLLSSGTLKRFDHEFVKSKSDSALCINASAYGDVDEFRQKIDEIEMNTRDLPKPQYVEKFNELPDYYRLD